MVRYDILQVTIGRFLLSTIHCGIHRGCACVVINDIFPTMNATYCANSHNTQKAKAPDFFLIQSKEKGD